MLRKTMVVSVAVAVLAFAGGDRVSADQGGSPNVEACTGQAIAALARNSELAGLKVTFGDLIISSVANSRDIQEQCAAGVSPNQIVEQAVQKVREAAGAP